MKAIVFICLVLLAMPSLSYSGIPEDCDNNRAKTQNAINQNAYAKAAQISQTAAAQGIKNANDNINQIFSCSLEKIKELSEAAWSKVKSIQDLIGTVLSGEILKTAQKALTDKACGALKSAIDKVTTQATSYSPLFKTIQTNTPTSSTLNSQTVSIINTIFDGAILP